MVRRLRPVDQRKSECFVLKWLGSDRGQSFQFSLQNAFGDINIPEEFDPPKPQRISQLTKLSHNVSSDSIVILDAKRISIPQLTYDGLGEDTYFWVGQGSRPSPKGTKVPDENG